jgi:hypothetical protein
MMVRGGALLLTACLLSAALQIQPGGRFIIQKGSERLLDKAPNLLI